MADPLDALHSPIAPIRPDPAFAARLRARLERALVGHTTDSELEGAAMSNTLESEATPATEAAHEVISPYLAVADARRALDWYVEAFGARRLGEPIVMPDGRIGHAEVELAGTVVMMADDYPEIGAVGPDPAGPVSVMLYLPVTDVDAATARAVDAGANVERPPADYPHGRTATLRDPFGHRWMLGSPPLAAAVATEPVRQGDAVYMSLWVPDVERAAAFFAAVLGWEYAPEESGHARQVVGTTLQHGIWANQSRPTLMVCHAVDDIASAIERVRTAGGQAGEPTNEPYGIIADCVDPEGLPFALWQALPGETSNRTPVNGAGSGDISYLTYEVVDSARERAFYGDVLGWRFAPGRIDDGWQVDDVVPMSGMSGGHALPTVVPMYRVDDIFGAVARVRAAAGSATDPEQQPYGWTSDCTDDQGTHFFLGQH